MRWLMRWLLIVGGYCAFGACVLGTPGELDQGGFRYDCAGPADPRCDYEFDFPDANECNIYLGSGPFRACDFLNDSSCGTFCDPGPSLEKHTIPGPIAVGARFTLSFNSIRYPFASLFSASTELLDQPDAFLARAPGTVAVLARTDDYVVDFVYIELQEPSRLRFDFVRTDRSGTADATGLTLGLDQVAWIRAMPMGEYGRLYGSLPCAWSEDASALSIVTDSTDNLIGVAGDATGFGELHLTLGPLEGVFPVWVDDATSLNGDAP